MKPSAATKVLLQLQWWLILIILVFSTVIFGGIGPEAIYVIRLLILFSFVLQLVLFCLEDRYLNDFHPAISLPIFIFAAFLMLVYLQYFFGLRILYNSTIGSVNSFLSYRLLLQLIIYFVFFIVCLKVFAKRQRVERLTSWMVVFTFVVAALGLAERLTTGDRILWKAFSAAQLSGFGPFLNENHFGGFLAFTFPLALGLMHYRFNRVTTGLALNQMKKNFWAVWLALMNEGVAFLFFFVILTLVACFFSVARLSLFVLLFCCISYFVVYSIKKRNIKFFLTLLIILACSFLLLHWLKYSVLNKHFNIEAFKTALDIRFQVAKQSLSLLYERPFFGSGLGTYGLVSSKVVAHPLLYGVWWNHAHNDYVELLTDTGVIGFGLWMGAILILLFSCLTQLRKNSSHWNKCIATQSIISILCISAMEFFDYHLRVPSLALLFILQLAFLIQASYSKDSHDIGPSRHVSPFLKGAVVLVGLVLLIPIVSFSTRDYRVFKLTQTEDHRRLFNLQKATQLQPSDSEPWYLLGQEYRKQAKQLNHDSQNALTLKLKGLTALRKAVVLSPTQAHYWYYLGILEYEVGYDKEGISSLEKAVYWSPVLLKYSIYLLAAYLRESEKIRPSEEQIEFLKKAQTLYNRLQALEVKPGEGHYGTWMGEYYHQKLQQLIPVWNVEENHYQR